MTSARDKISRKLAPVLRKLQDVDIDIIGTKTQLLRISRSAVDDFGYASISYESQVIDNCYLNYPITELEMIDNKINSVTNFEALDLLDILPVELKIKFHGDYNTEQTEVRPGDYLVDILRDQNDTPIPIILRVERPIGGFLNKYLVSKKFELSLVKGNLPSSIQVHIDDYIQNA